MKYEGNSNQTNTGMNHNPAMVKAIDKINTIIKVIYIKSIAVI